MISANPMPQGSVRFGVFRLDLVSRKLYKRDRQVRIKGQSLRILELLLQRPRNIVTREELIEDLWPKTVHVDFEAGLNTAIKNLRAVLGDSAENPQFIETVPLRGYRFIAAAEIEVPDSSREQQSVPTPSPTPPGSDEKVKAAANLVRQPRGLRKRIAVIAIVLAIATGLGLAVLRLYRKTELTKANSVPVRRSVAIVGFKNLSNRADQEWISTLLSEELTAELDVSEDLRTIPGESIARMKRDLPLPDTDKYARDTLTHVRAYLDTDYVILGSFFAPLKSRREEVRVDIRLQDAATGETIASITDRAKETDLPALVSRLGAELRQKLGMAMLSTAQSAFVQATLPSSLPAMHLYSEGLMHLRSLDMQKARDLLKNAVDAEPAFPLAHSALAESWSALGFEENARKEAAQAHQLATKLPRQDQLLVEALYFQMNHNWEKTIQTYEMLFSLFPDNLEYGLHLANAQSTAGKGKEALLTVEALRKLPLSSREDPRIDLAEAVAAKSLGDYKHEREAAASAGAKATAQGARLEIAEAKLEEGGALDDLSQPKAAVALEGEAKTIFTAAGDQGGVARALNDLGNANLHKGDLIAAERLYAESSEISARIGNKRLLAKSLSNIAIVRYQQGHLASAAKFSQQAADSFQEIGDLNAVATALNNIATIHTDLGNLSLARQKYEESLAIARAAGDTTSLARTLANFARLLLREGDLRGAQDRCQEALTTPSSPRERSYALQGLGDVFFWQGDLDRAKHEYGEALNARRQMSDDELVAESQLMIAEVLLRQGNFPQAQTNAQAAVDEFRKAENGDEQAEGEAVLARALLGQARPEQAREAIAQATSLAGKSEDREVRLVVGIEWARVSSDTGDPQAAVTRLESVISEAKRYTYFGYELEATEFLGEIELKGPNAEKGRARLSALAKRATTSGFGLVAGAARERLSAEAGQNHRRRQDESAQK